MNTVADSRIFKIKRNLADAGLNEPQAEKFLNMRKRTTVSVSTECSKSIKYVCLKNCMKVSTR